VGVAALVVIAFYLLIGLLDSLHFHPRIEPSREPRRSRPRTAGVASRERPKPAAADAGEYSTQVLSVLDLWLTGLRERQEKTFSAPFATHLFVKEPIEQPDGSVVRGYPRWSTAARTWDPAHRSRLRHRRARGCSA
jgi:peptide/nickel transport system permease protein